MIIDTINCLHRYWCGLWGGHEDIRVTEDGWLRLRCVKCQRMTEGWDCHRKGSYGD